jgi:hypothetical protein
MLSDECGCEYIYQYSISTAGMLCSLFRKWSGNCTYGNATALQSLREFTHDNGGDSWGKQAAGFRVNLIIT